MSKTCALSRKRAHQTRDLQQPTLTNSQPQSQDKESAKSDHQSPVGVLATVKVPQTAKSISDGRLKTWQKKVVATIETDKVVPPITSELDHAADMEPSGYPRGLACSSMCWPAHHG